ncbi:hypothetical protein [Rhodomicrobium sp.]|uniref:hypothetical protein n=1 Tax=Rhodomicrobium sp. TaxID=2720632 RepID=UPI0039E253E5
MAAQVAEAQVKLTLLDGVSAGIQRIQERFAALSRAIGLDRVTAAARRLGEALARVRDGFGQSMGRLSAFIAALGLGGGGAIAAATSLGKHVSALSEDFDKLSKAAGISAEVLQELQYAGRKSGVDTGLMASSLKDLRRRALEFVETGEGAGAEAFKKLGYRAGELKKKMQTPAALFSEIIERIGKLKEMDRIKVVEGLFGGEEMLKMIGLTAAQIRELRVEARESGTILGNDVVAFSAVYRENLDALERRLESFRNRLGAQLLPVLNDAAESSLKWLEANRKLIQTKIEEWAGKITRVVRDLLNPSSDLRQRIAAIGDEFKRWAQRIQPAIDFLGGPLNAAMLAVGAYIAGPFVAAVAMAVSSVIMFGAALMMTPFGWILGGIAALGAIVYVLIAKWDEFVAYWGNLWTRATSGFEQGFILGVLKLLHEFNPLVHIARGIDAVIEYFFGVSLLDAGSKLIDSLWEGMRAGWTRIESWLREKVSALTDWMPDWITGGETKVETPAAPSVASPALAAPAPEGRGAEWAPDWVKRPPEWLHPMPESRASTMAAPKVPTVPFAQAAREVDAQTVQAGTVQAQKLTIPEPLVVHKPQTVNAPFTVHLTVNGGSGSPADIAAAVRGALAAQAAQQRAAVQSHLSD